MVYKFFDKKSTSLINKSASGSGISNENISNKELTGELHKPIIKKIWESQLHSPFIDNIWDTDLADTQLTSKFNPNLGGFFRSLFWGRWVKLTHCLKLVTIILEPSGLACKYTHIYTFRKNTF